jgi:Cu/Ag efflux pump CusA
MAANGVSLQQLANAVNTNNRNDGAGRLGEGMKFCWFAVREHSHPG